MKSNKMILLFSHLALASFLLSACQSSSSQPVTEEQTTKTEVVQNTEDLSSNSDNQIPEYLPSGFPLPEDAVIEMSLSDLKDGKKAALLVYMTKEEDLESLSELYEDYFKSQNLEDSQYILNDRNLLIMGKNMEQGYDWALKGGILIDDLGVQVTVNWSEL